MNAISQRYCDLCGIEKRRDVLNRFNKSDGAILDLCGKCSDEQVTKAWREKLGLKGCPRSFMED